MPSIMTPKQTNLLFKFICCKLKTEIVAAKVETRLRRELMIKKSKAYIATSVATAITATAAAPAKAQAWNSKVKKNNITSEVPFKVISIIFRFVGLLQKKNVRIFQNKFKPINLYCLSHIRGLRFNTLQDHDRIGIDDKMIRLQKTSETYKDFGKFFYNVWADAFYNYTTVFVFLFGKQALNLHSVLDKLYNNVHMLSTVYKWQDLVFPMAIEAHLFIVVQQSTDLSKWVILEKFQDRFCTAKRLIGMG